MPIGWGVLTASEVNAELGRAKNATFSMNNSPERALAEKPVNESLIKFSDFKGKRAKPAYALVGWATNVLQQRSDWDSGDQEFTWDNISRDTRLRSRVWACTNGSASHRYPQGFVYLRWRIYTPNKGTLLYDSIKWNQYTYKKDGSAPIHNWSAANYIRDLVGSSSENVVVVINMRCILGSYYAHIWGERYIINRICGIESEVGY